MSRLISTITLFLMGSANLMACELCKKNQPEILQDVTHGPGPQGQWDYIIIWIALIIVAITLFFSIKFLVRPHEENPDHIKNIVVNPNLKSYE